MTGRKAALRLVVLSLTSFPLGMALGAVGVPVVVSFGIGCLLGIVLMNEMEDRGW